ncbi:uncharacterized protein HMPREF1120_07213 [Exophiala dermatitidis NIH/UT8656]|uniref:Uncharacterized protein n=1 Tax=Exophiala dermatitidis (strain ATCC 34100 / CBS 525.76 / NIH/UT8656) TaxID=858893 RepID=H6C672_EXODN|nr:uncharacterized protein HMPREF1120_07213 [Exophiala dermatitidis NIH/UT8656]EHY59218.1 hypothetical protein HMPREF1120_07213 [Exophiala dermatitidis NIH/UT8656]
MENCIKPLSGFALSKSTSMLFGKEPHVLRETKPRLSSSRYDAKSDKSELQNFSDQLSARMKETVPLTESFLVCCLLLQLSFVLIDTLPENGSLNSHLDCPRILSQMQPDIARVDPLLRKAEKLVLRS